MAQFFKGDKTEKQIFDSADPLMSILSSDKDEFFDGAYDAKPLGGVIHDGNLSPLVNAIPRSVFESSFNTLFNSFVSAGSFEAYIDVFKKIFGVSMAIVFTVPAPGQLDIDITADSVENFNFIARRIVSNAYIYDQVVTQSGDKIVFTGIQGIQSQGELELMLFEMVPQGIFTQITLTLGV